MTILKSLFRKKSGARYEVWEDDRFSGDSTLIRSYRFKIFAKMKLRICRKEDTSGMLRYSMSKIEPEEIAERKLFEQERKALLSKISDYNYADLKLTIKELSCRIVHVAESGCLPDTDEEPIVIKIENKSFGCYESIAFLYYVVKRDNEEEQEREVVVEVRFKDWSKFLNGFPVGYNVRMNERVTYGEVKRDGCFIGTLDQLYTFFKSEERVEKVISEVGKIIFNFYCD